MENWVYKGIERNGCSPSNHFISSFSLFLLLKLPNKGIERLFLKTHFIPFISTISLLPNIVLNFQTRE
jgi:hypothetical protein